MLNRLKLLFVVAVVSLLAACATVGPIDQPITNQQQTSLLPPAPNSALANQLVKVSYNWTQCLAIGCVPATQVQRLTTDLGCVDDALKSAGIGIVPDPNVKSFVPQTGDPLSDASVLFIRQLQATGSSLLPEPSQSCDAVLGRVTRNALLGAGTIAAGALPSVGGLGAAIRKFGL